MHTDINGRQIKIGDIVKRICGGPHGTLKVGDTGIVTELIKVGPNSTNVRLRGQSKDISFNGMFMKIISSKINHLPEWL